MAARFEKVGTAARLPLAGDFSDGNAHLKSEALPFTGQRHRLLRQVQVTEPTKAKASAALKAIRDRVTAGAPARDDTIVFGRFAARWIETTLAASDRSTPPRLCTRASRGRTSSVATSEGSR